MLSSLEVEQNNIHINKPRPETGATEPAPTKKPASKRGGRRELYSTLAVIILAPLIAWLLTAFVFQSYQVDGPSMQPTLHNNDRLIVNKLGRTWTRVFGGNFTPRRYDIVVFSETSAALEGGKKQLIKRVIGLPGDTVSIKNGQVTIYNKEHPDGFLVDQFGPEAHSIDYTDGNTEQKIEDGQIFVMGDNRQNSLDSRAFGAVDSKNIIGTLSVRIYPFNSIEKF